MTRGGLTVQTDREARLDQRGAVRLGEKKVLEEVG